MSNRATTSQIADPKLESEAGFDLLNVLLVDDNAFARSIGGRALRSAGVRAILEAASGREAMEFLGSSAPAVDVVFCDLMMPDMDGIQIVRHIAALTVPPAIVFVSGADEVLLSAAENTARARGLHVIGAIEKPLTPEAVRRALARLGEKPASDRSRRAIDVSPADLQEALAAQQFLPYFQPKISLADCRVMGFEALARWQHPDKGLIFPNTFIPIAEQSGQIGALTDQIMMLSLKQCAAWGDAGLRTKVNVNLSAHMLVDLDLPDRLAREAERFQVDPHQLILEITESGLFHDAANTLDILARLHMKGFPLSIDDFGTGYSSMEQLRRVPFAEMKIDRAFVCGAGENAKAMAILESSANLGRGLQMSVVAEGVETKGDWNAVQAAGIDLAQGYFMARPMAAEQIPVWLAQWVSQHPV
jgi:EAL domain-containing protein (putative c-di-GMP-specific phosphodiesterase class I)/FixJ family two-component response regulator